MFVFFLIGMGGNSVLEWFIRLFVLFCLRTKTHINTLKPILLCVWSCSALCGFPPSQACCWRLRTLPYLQGEHQYSRTWTAQFIGALEGARAYASWAKIPQYDAASPTGLWQREKIVGSDWSGWSNLQCIWKHRYGCPSTNALLSMLSRNLECADWSSACFDDWKRCICDCVLSWIALPLCRRSSPW